MVASVAQWSDAHPAAAAPSTKRSGEHVGTDPTIDDCPGGALAKQPRKCRPSEHPLAAWCLENGSILSVAWLRSRLRMPSSKRRSFLRLFGGSLIGGLVVIEGSMLFQKALTDLVYKHIPYFTDRNARQSRLPLSQAFREWLRCNFLTHTVTSSIIALIMTVAPKHEYEKIMKPRRFSLSKFLVKLAFVRFVSDIAFYVVHRALHSRLLYHLHKRHHEHTATALNTNLHFSVPDLVLEGFVPLITGLFALQGIGVKSSQLEANLLTAYIQWYEIGSHSGKPVPTVTLFPPLAPIYRLFLGDVDARNIEFHDEHHRTNNCNYGITQWLDRVLGTAKLR